MRRLRLLLAASAISALAACGVLTTTNINSLLGSSAASTALSYIAGLNPTIAGYLTDANSAIAANVAVRQMTQAAAEMHGAS
ncbi:MAG TPA: hypothetical protein VHW66_18905 [Stellaceae bacterium]|jgi:hypothetical protein|nr:hypothetical protein [Stellaceae bacterium]